MLHLNKDKKIENKSPTKELRCAGLTTLRVWAYEKKSLGLHSKALYFYFFKGRMTVDDLLFTLLIKKIRRHVIC